MIELETVEAEYRWAERLSREVGEELGAQVGVISRRLTQRRPARWTGARVDVLRSWPTVPYTLVASLQSSGTATQATAIVYEGCPEPSHLAAHPSRGAGGVRLLANRAREFGADAIVVHRADGATANANLFASPDVR